MYCRNKLRISVVFKALFFAHRRPDHQLHDLLSVVPNRNSNSIHICNFIHQRVLLALTKYKDTPYSVIDQDQCNSKTSEGAVCSSKHAKWWSDAGLAIIKHLHTSKTSSQLLYQGLGFPLSSTTGKDLHYIRGKSIKYPSNHITFKKKNTPTFINQLRFRLHPPTLCSR